MEDFARTRRGSKFFELDIPKIAEQLERIAAQMERKNRIEEKRLILEQRKYNKENKIIDESDINDLDSGDFIKK